MNLNKTVKVLTVVLGGIVLGACGSTGGTKSDSMDGSGSVAVEDRSGAQSTGYMGQRSFKREAMDDPASPLSRAPADASPGKAGLSGHCG